MIIFAIIIGFIGVYKAGTGKPRTFLLANKKLRIVSEVRFKTHNWVDCYCFKAIDETADIDDYFVIPVYYAIPRIYFSRKPNLNSTIIVDKSGKKIQTVL